MSRHLTNLLSLLRDAAATIERISEAQLRIAQYGMVTPNPQTGSWAWACEQMLKGRRVRLPYFFEGYYWYFEKALTESSTNNPTHQTFPPLMRGQVESMNWELFDPESAP